MVLEIGWCEVMRDVKEITGFAQYITNGVPGSTRRWLNFWLILGHRLRRWPNISQTLGQRLVFAGVTHEADNAQSASCLSKPQTHTLNSVLRTLLDV